jgi:hypothetical protein
MAEPRGQVGNRTLVMYLPSTRITIILQDQTHEALSRNFTKTLCINATLGSEPKTLILDITLCTSYITLRVLVTRIELACNRT